MEDSEFRDYDSLVGRIYEASRNPLHGASMLGGYVKAFASAGVTVSVFQKLGTGVDLGMATGMRRADYVALSHWHSHPMVLLLERKEFKEARRISDLVPANAVKHERWYKELFQDSGIHYALLRDLSFGTERARLMLLRGPGESDFSNALIGRFELACGHFEAAFRDASRKWLSAACSISGDIAFGLGVSKLTGSITTIGRVEAFLLENTTLSASEARVAAALRNGQNLKSCTLALDLSMNTVRTHLKNIYSKLGISRLPELVYFLNNI